MIVAVFDDPAMRCQKVKRMAGKTFVGEPRNSEEKRRIALPDILVHPRHRRTGGLSNGTLIVVQGAVQALGTRDRPIHIFSERGPAAMTLTQVGSASNPESWRGFQMRGAGQSTFRQVIMTGAGNGTVVAHPRPPIFGLLDTHSLTVDRCVFTDSGGMVFSGQGVGTYIVRKGRNDKSRHVLFDVKVDHGGRNCDDEAGSTVGKRYIFYIDAGELGREMSVCLDPSLAHCMGPYKRK